MNEDRYQYFVEITYIDGFTEGMTVTAETMREALEVVLDVLILSDVVRIEVNEEGD